MQGGFPGQGWPVPFGKQTLLYQQQPRMHLLQPVLLLRSPETPPSHQPGPHKGQKILHSSSYHLGTFSQTGVFIGCMASTCKFYWFNPLSELHGYIMWRGAKLQNYPCSREPCKETHPAQHPPVLPHRCSSTIYTGISTEITVRPGFNSSGHKQRPFRTRAPFSL